MYSSQYLRTAPHSRHGQWLAESCSNLTTIRLGTLAIYYATRGQLPDELRPAILRMQRINLWTLGLIAHESDSSILALAAFEEDTPFRDTHRLDPWIENELSQWGGWDNALSACERLVGVLSEAFIAPETDNNPLLEDGWQTAEAYENFCASPKAQVPKEYPGKQAEVSDTSQITVMSDYWITQEITKLGASAQFTLALEHCDLWRKARPQKILPLVMAVRLLHAQGQIAERDKMVDSLTALGCQDLNELEEARVTLGELELWAQQIKILDQMDELAPEHPVILANRGAARIQTGEVALGKRDLESALTLDPENGPALANLGLQLMREENYLQAREVLEQAVQQNPEQAQARVYLAACKNNQGEPQGAIEQLEQAIKLDPENVQAQTLLQQLRDRSKS